MTFSSGVKLGDLDDFITPAQDCVVPFMQAATGKLDVGEETVLEKPKEEKPDLIKASKTDGQAAQVSLSDCLACSGCVTSAETVLLQEQSVEEFATKALSSPLTVVSIAPQSIAAFAVDSGLAPEEVLPRLRAKLKSLGASYVLGTAACDALALVEAKRAFDARKGPVITSHCPGWTCYAEKVVEGDVIPMLLPLRSPQQLQGQWVKTALVEVNEGLNFLRENRAKWHWLGKHYRRPKPASRDTVYHCFVQPCYDKKIEAARPQFRETYPEVDTVLATRELQELVGDLRDVQADPFDWTPAPFGLTTVPVHQGFGSGGFLDFVFRGACADRGSPVAAHSKLEFVSKNKDLHEVVLKDGGGKVQLRFVAAHGFRNVQNILKRLKRGDKIDFVEMMACPGGCLNGGGQLSGREKMEEMVQAVHSLGPYLEPTRLASAPRGLATDAKYKQLSEGVTASDFKW